jgi:O-antigen ligase
LTWAEYPDVGFKRWVKAVGDFVMVLIVVSDREPEVAIRRLLVRTGFLLIPLSVLMIKYYPNLARYYDRWDWSTYFSGVTTNKNALGVICLLFGLASAWQCLVALFGEHTTGRARRLIAHGAILGMVVWLFSLANSMTSLACFGIGFATLLALALRRQPRGGGPSVGVTLVNRMILHALVAVLIAVPSIVLFAGMGSILEMMGRSPTLTDRTLVWDLLLAQTENPLFGAGFENFWLGPRLERIWRVYSWAPTQAHNGYLETYLNLGWAGIALLVFVLAVGYRTVTVGLRGQASTSTLMLAYFVVGIVYNFTEAAFFRMTTPAWLALLLAMTRVPDTERAKRQLSLARRPIRQRSPVQLRGRDPAGENAVAVSRES